VGQCIRKMGVGYDSHRNVNCLVASCVVLRDVRLEACIYSVECMVNVTRDDYVVRSTVKAL
jgi:hypothetical protein